ncbi:MAG: hypothetical protein FWF77_01680 [Defluviitaleaceae bacterium]|nr:hypothetical protein [Defluviitaleaceae bacterium]
MTNRERLENMRREHARERNETRDDEMYTREGEDLRIETIREKMASVLNDAEITAEKRKELLAHFKEEIEVILDERDEREYNFIERELEHHRLEQELAQEIESEEREERGEEAEDAEILPFVRPLITAGAEQMRKEIEEKRRELNEEEQCNTILLSTSERGEIPGFTQARRRKRRGEEQNVRIDTFVSRQREITLMYHMGKEMQEQLLNKNKKSPTLEDFDDSDLPDEFEVPPEEPPAEELSEEPGEAPPSEEE